MNNRKRLKVTRRMARQSLKLLGIKRPGLALEIMLQEIPDRQAVMMGCFLSIFRSDIRPEWAKMPKIGR